MSKQTKSALGRGLDALITMDDLNTNGSSSINEVELSKIEANPDQPRSVFDKEALDELATSIRALGLVQPITLREIRPDRYQIISGERRYRASLMAGLTSIPAYIKKASDENIMEMALIENIQREDLNPIEIALAFQTLIDTHNLTQEKLSERIGKKRGTIANFLRLLKLPAEIQIGLKDKKIDMGHAKSLLSLENASDQLMIYEEIKEYGYSVRHTEEIVKSINNPQEQETDETPSPTPSSPKKKSSVKYDSYKKQLSDIFNAKVSVSSNEKGTGKISIPFTNEDELTRIMQVFDSIKNNS
ncbi:MAG: ParB/RepB/Spo0J family partition protein [Dysgonamonadaceae bacterium]|jgi:ParB family chromosome partitioning protein|nr:ParB/RepB/Spo0J family partition protein [Dysgonamonadaceae bacterium]